MAKYTLKTLGATNLSKTERSVLDYYATDPRSVRAILNQISFGNTVVWDPGSGHNSIINVLKEAGYKTRSTDIYDYGYQDEIIDFLEYNEKWHGSILMNPPYNCFSSDTECYTKRGWLHYDELNEKDEVLSVNPYTLELEWSKINTIISKEVDEELFHFKKSHLDILCTKNHRMFAYNITTQKLAVKNNDLIKSQDIRTTHYIPRTGYCWQGKTIDKFVLPGIQGYSYNKLVFKPDIEIDIKNWLEFFGLWLADGYCRHTKNSRGNERKTVGIKQSIKTANKVREILDKLPFKYSEYTDNTKRLTPCINFEIHNEQLWSYLSQFGTSQNKYIPDFIKELSKELLTVFIDAYFFGDGSYYADNGRIYRTTSKKLIEDIQEILLKLGYLSHITTHEYTISNGNKRSCYSICQSSDSVYNNYFYPSAKSDKCKVHYKGIVWCVNLEKNGVFLLRRNNKEFFSGNCALDFVLKALEVVDEGAKVVVFLRTLFLEGTKRYEKLFKDQPPKTVYVFSNRQVCSKVDDFTMGSAVSYAWFVWEKGSTSDPVIKWIQSEK